MTSLVSESFYEENEDDKNKCLPRGHAFCRQRRKGQALATFQKTVRDIVGVKRALDRWNKKRHSLVHLTECEQKMLAIIVEKFERSSASEREPLLHMAVRSGCAAVAESVLEDDSVTTQRSNKGQTALHVAAEADFHEIAALLLHYEKDKRKALHVARMLSRTDETEVSDLDDREETFQRCEKIMKTINSNPPIRTHIDGDMICAEDEWRLLTSVTYCPDMMLLLCRDTNFFTPFSTAALKGSRGVLSVLFQHARQCEIHAVMWKDILHSADLCRSSLLHLAVKSGHLPVVRMCFEQGVNIKHQMSDGDTALHLAAQLGFVDIIKYLLSKDTETLHMKNKNGRTPLHEASKMDQPAAVEILLSKGAEIDVTDGKGNTPVFLAAHHGSTESVRGLIKFGANIMIKNDAGCTIVHQSVGHIEAMEVVLQAGCIDKAFLNVKDNIDQDTALHYAASGGYYKNVVQLLNRGAHPNSRNFKKRIPLHVAAENGWLHTAQHLIAYSRTQKSINATDYKGKTPLHRAAANGRNRLVLALVGKGACVLRDAQEMTPLHYAAGEGSVDCCRMIIQSDEGCLNDRDRSGDTALHYAARENQAETVKFLLDEGAAIVMNHVSQNPLDVAIDVGATEAAETFAGHDRWESLLREKVRQPVVDEKKVVKLQDEEETQIQRMIAKMPDVALKFLDRCHYKDEKVETFDFRFLQGYSKNATCSLKAFWTMRQLRVKKCLAHPVCCALLNVQWLRYGWFFFTLKGVGTLIQVLFLSLYIVEAHPHHVNWPKTSSRSSNVERGEPSTSHFFQALQYLTVITSIIHLLNYTSRLRKCHMMFLEELKGAGFSLTILSTTLTCAFVLPFKDQGEDHRWVIGSLAVFFSWMLLTLYLRRLPYFGLYLVMVGKMFKRLLQVLLVVALLTLAFGFAFYALLAPISNSYFAFHQFGLSILKIFTMMIGEVDFNEMFLPNQTHPQDHSAVPQAWLGLLYVFFVLFMAVLVMNLLVGLAVGDIESVRERATLEGYIMQVSLHLELENMLPDFLLRKYWVDSSKQELLKTRSWKGALWKRLSLTGGHSNSDLQKPPTLDEQLQKFMPVLESLGERLTYQDQRINDIRLKMNKLADALLPAEPEPDWKRIHPLTFKEAALKTLATTKRNKAIRKHFQRFAASNAAESSKQNEAGVVETQEEVKFLVGGESDEVLQVGAGGHTNLCCSYFCALELWGWAPTQLHFHTFLWIITN
eukprot:m.52270 g.52270  ORF g.52270 m.52270 type:complete len:1225 (+) comp34199_c0_seq4:92-3766(+)